MTKTFWVGDGKLKGFPSYTFQLCRASTPPKFLSFFHFVLHFFQFLIFICFTCPIFHCFFFQFNIVPFLYFTWFRFFFKNLARLPASPSRSLALKIYKLWALRQGLQSSNAFLDMISRIWSWAFGMDYHPVWTFPRALHPPEITSLISAMMGSNNIVILHLATRLFYAISYSIINMFDFPVWMVNVFSSTNDSPGVQLNFQIASKSQLLAK